MHIPELLFNSVDSEVMFVDDDGNSTPRKVLICMDGKQVRLDRMGVTGRADFGDICSAFHRFTGASIVYVPAPDQHIAECISSQLHARRLADRTWCRLGTLQLQLTLAPQSDGKNRFYYQPSLEQPKCRSLSPAARASFDQLRLGYVVYDGLSDEQERELFQRVQQGMPLNGAEKLSSYRGPFADWISSYIAEVCNPASSTTLTPVSHSPIPPPVHRH